MMFRITLIILALAIWQKTWAQYRAAHVSKAWFVLTSALWLLVIGAAITPSLTDEVAALVGVGRGADLFVYIAVVVLFYGFSRIMVSQEKQRHELTELTRQIAIRDAKSAETK